MIEGFSSMHHTTISLRLSQAEPHDEYQYRIGEAIEQSIDLVAADRNTD